MILVLAYIHNNHLKIGNPYLGSMIALSINLIVLITKTVHFPSRINNQGLLYDQNQNKGNGFLELIIHDEISH